MTFSFDNSYARLPERFYAKLPPTAVAGPRLIRLNTALARELRLDADLLATAEGVAVLAGNRLPVGAEPLAMAYAGHQFGGWSPQLGDGRAILLGEVVDEAGQRRDIQLKGAGRTPFSRSGDGRAWLGPVLREYVVSEAMHALGVPTTRALAAVATGEPVLRERVLPGAILTRVASSHIRVGTFQFFAARGDEAALRLLADHVIARHEPDAATAEEPYRVLLEGVVARQAALVAQWLALGFIHGVMNTDNMSIAGETIDYGPCAFMDAYHPGRVLSSIDHQGRYAYGNQPRIASWNLARLAQSLLPLLAPDETRSVEIAQASVDAFVGLFEAAFAARFAAKIGLARARDGDLELVQALLQHMTEGEADFTLTFRRLAALKREPGPADAALGALFADPVPVDTWLAQWRQRLAHETADDEQRQAAMRAVNPAFIPRNHLVETVIVAAAERDDFKPFEALLDVLARPYDDQDGRERYAQPPQPDEVVQATFCGT